MSKRILWCAVALLMALLITALAPNPSPAAGPEAGPGDIVTHTVTKGDNLHLLAGYYYKDPRQWRRIYSLNRSSIVDPHRISPGDELQIKTEPARQWDIPYKEFLARVYR